MTGAEVPAVDAAVEVLPADGSVVGASVLAGGTVVPAPRSGSVVT